jgi:NitT/TauT family transport system substrate-binding protein
VNAPLRRLAALILLPILAACGGGPSAVIPSGCLTTGAAGGPSAACSTPSASVSSTHLTVGLGYIPSIQFAPFYLARENGYYRAAGLDVTFQNGNDDTLVTLVGQGAIDIGLSDGTSVIPAVANGLPIRYVTTIYAKLPNIVFAKTSSGIRTVADLKGRKLGTPGKFGSSWIMLQALLGSVGLKTSDVNIQLYPDFGQGGALAQGAIDAATGFVNNEPVQLALAGTPTTVIAVDSILPLPGNGLIAGVATLQDKHAALKAFVAATLRAMAEITADPNSGIAPSLAAAPSLAGTDKATLLAVLKATIATWSSDYTVAHGAGSIDHSAWQRTATFMVGLKDGTVASAPPIDQLVDDSLLGP